MNDHKSTARLGEFGDLVQGQQLTATSTTARFRVDAHEWQKGAEHEQHANEEQDFVRVCVAEHQLIVDCCKRVANSQHRDDSVHCEGSFQLGLGVSHDVISIIESRSPTHCSAAVCHNKRKHAAAGEQTQS